MEELLFHNPIQKSLSGGNVGSLVGVAISASLLPPMVNGGILLGVALASINHCSVDGTCVIPTASPPTTTKAPSLTNDTVTATTIDAFTDLPSSVNASSSTTALPFSDSGATNVMDPHHVLCSYSLGLNEYERVYRCALPAEAALLGVTSIFLTILNIACIFLMAIVVFKIKEVVPKAALSSGEDFRARLIYSFILAAPLSLPLPPHPSPS